MNLEDYGTVIYAYSRAQAVEDGELVEVPTSLQKQAGLRFPVALTRAAWSKTVNLSEKAKAPGQSETGRLWDVLNLARFAILRSPHSDRANFTVNVSGRNVKMYVHCGPGDTLDPVLTILLQGED